MMHGDVTDQRAFMRLKEYVEITRGGCWQWTGLKDRDGYGKVGWQGKTWLAHRAVYVLLKGEIPPGACLDHRCRNRACVNPLHVDPISRAENNMKGLGVGALNARKTHCNSGHPFSARNTYEWHGKRLCRECNRVAAAKYRASKGGAS